MEMTHRSIREADEAMLYPELLFANDRDSGIEQKIVDIVNATGCRILKGKDAEIAGASRYRLYRLLKRGESNEFGLSDRVSGERRGASA